MKDTVFTTFSFGKLHVHQQNQMRESILKIYPDANMMFWSTEDSSSTHPPDSVPPGYTNHATSTYGFKVHCVRNCLNAGYKKVIFFDAAMTLQSPIDKVMELANKLGVLATRGGAYLNNVTSDRCLAYVGKTREQVAPIQMVGGSVYIFDFTNPVAMKVFEYWEDLEHKGYFGKEDDHSNGLLQGHRQDETCMALAMYEYDVPVVGYDELGYHNMGMGENKNYPFVFCKLHHRDVGTIGSFPFVQHLIPVFGVIYYNGDDQEVKDFFLKNEYKMDKSLLHKEHYDLVLLDMNLLENEILGMMPHPLAKQVSLKINTLDADELIKKLSEHYVVRAKTWGSVLLIAK
ncbi:MAG: hypothetical protein NUV80_02730 [Candidatus Berkelbacteria bacterium]|nr:hypothetical protein [Candidatus Berkelbacteria bacterium]